MWRLAISAVLLAACNRASGQGVMRVPPPDMKAIHDTLAVVRYGIDMEMAAKAKLIVVCYITNPKRWKGTPNLACVASPLTP